MKNFLVSDMLETQAFYLVYLKGSSSIGEMNEAALRFLGYRVIKREFNRINVGGNKIKNFCSKYCFIVQRVNRSYYMPWWSSCYAESPTAFYSIFVYSCQ